MKYIIVILSVVCLMSCTKRDVRTSSECCKDVVINAPEGMECSCE